MIMESVSLSIRSGGAADGVSLSLAVEGHESLSLSLAVKGHESLPLSLAVEGHECNVPT